MMDEFWTRSFQLRDYPGANNGVHGWLHSWRLHNGLWLNQPPKLICGQQYLHVRVAAYPYIVVIFRVLLSSIMVEENCD